MSKLQAPPPIFSPEQCRAARAVLDLTIPETCRALSMGTTTLQTFEAGGDIRASSVDRLRSLFEERGVTFSDDGQGIRWSDGQP